MISDSIAVRLQLRPANPRSYLHQCIETAALLSLPRRAFLLHRSIQLHVEHKCRGEVVAEHGRWRPLTGPR